MNHHQSFRWVRVELRSGDAWGKWPGKAAMAIVGSGTSRAVSKLASTFSSSFETWHDGDSITSSAFFDEVPSEEPFPFPPCRRRQGDIFALYSSQRFFFSLSFCSCIRLAHTTGYPAIAVRERDVAKFRYFDQVRGDAIEEMDFLRRLLEKKKPPRRRPTWDVLGHFAVVVVDLFPNSPFSLFAMRRRRASGLFRKGERLCHSWATRFTLSPDCMLVISSDWYNALVCCQHMQGASE